MGPADWSVILVGVLAVALAYWCLLFLTAGLLEFVFERWM